MLKRILEAFNRWYHRFGVGKVVRSVERRSLFGCPALGAERMSHFSKCCLHFSSLSADFSALAPPRKNVIEEFHAQEGACGFGRGSANVLEHTDSHPTDFGQLAASFGRSARRRGRLAHAAGKGMHAGERIRDLGISGLARFGFVCALCSFSQNPCALFSLAGRFGYGRCVVVGCLAISGATRRGGLSFDWFGWGGFRSFRRSWWYCLLQQHPVALFRSSLSLRSGGAAVVWKFVRMLFKQS